MIKLVHIMGNSNRISDCLSRFEDPEKRKLFMDLTAGKQIKFREVVENVFKFWHNW